MEEYYTAQICLNGHCINSYHEFMSSNPYFSQKGTSDNKFCEKCGEANIIECPVCKKPIRGSSSGSVVIPYSTPNYCYNCGKPFPWLERKMKAAIEMVELEETLSSEEINNLKVYTKDITTDTPNAQVSAKRINILFRKIAASSVPAIRALFVDIASETAKRIIMDTHH